MCNFNGMTPSIVLNKPWHTVSRKHSLDLDPSGPVVPWSEPAPGALEQNPFLQAKHQGKMKIK